MQDLVPLALESTQLSLLITLFRRYNIFFFISWASHATSLCFVIILNFFFLLIWLCWVFVESCRIFSWTLNCGMWDLVPWTGIKPWLPALELRVLATGSPGKSQLLHFFCMYNNISVIPSRSQYFVWWYVFTASSWLVYKITQLTGGKDSVQC